MTGQVCPHAAQLRDRGGADFSLLFGAGASWGRWLAGLLALAAQHHGGIGAELAEEIGRKCAGAAVSQLPGDFTDGVVALALLKPSHGHFQPLFANELQWCALELATEHVLELPP